jgi:hypothetical protein
VILLTARGEEADRIVGLELGACRLTRVTTAEAPDLIFAYEEHSGPARRVDSYLATVLQHRRNHATFRLHRLETATNPSLTSRLQIRETPCLVVLERGFERGRLIQPKSIASIRAFLAPWLV